MRVGIGYGLGKVIARDGLAVKAFKVQLHASGKARAGRNAIAVSGQGLHHANHFCAFFINGDGVEVIDFYIAVGAHRVGHGARVFRELGGAKDAHVFNAFDRAGRRIATQVLAEFLVPKNG